MTSHAYHSHKTVCLKETYSQQGALLKTGINMSISVPSLTFVSAGIGEDDLEEAFWSCDEEMKPESWEEMLESRAGACRGNVELRYRWQG